MSVGYMVPEDPSILSNRSVQWEDPLVALEEQLEEEEESGCMPGRDIHRVLEFLNKLPIRERDLIAQYYLGVKVQVRNKEYDLGTKRQADMAYMFEVTQAAVSYRLVRGITRLRYLANVPDTSEEELRQTLPEIFPNPIDVNILVGMWSSTCQSEVAKQLGLTQGRVRHRFFRAVDTLKKAAEENEKYEKFNKLFSTLANKSFNVLRSVKLPQWSGRGQDVCT